ncbi:MAG: ABC transporter permease [Fastidiosipilaceae bacterium]|jgi:ABC-type nitrate/sulfonate/bicarbonate transport system permease component
MKKSGHIKDKLQSSLPIVLLLVIWQVLSSSGLIPSFMLPSPVAVVKAFVTDFPLLVDNLWVTLLEAMLGLLTGVLFGFLFAMLMDRFRPVRIAIYPLLVLTQTIPTVAIAPLLVLWMGYGVAPKVLLIFIVTFFPITVNSLDGFQSVDPDEVRLLRAMGANNSQIFRYIKWPSGLNAFFSALRVSAAYAVLGAVIAEWLGGSRGLGVYMTRVRKSFAFDKMFAVIFLISALSLLLLALVKQIQRKSMPWNKKGN